MDGAIAPRDDRTPYARVGDLFVFACAAAVILTLLRDAFAAARHAAPRGRTDRAHEARLPGQQRVVVWAAHVELARRAPARCRPAEPCRPSTRRGAATRAPRAASLRIYLIKPSRYDADGSCCASAGASSPTTPSPCSPGSRTPAPRRARRRRADGAVGGAGRRRDRTGYDRLDPRARRRRRRRGCSSALAGVQTGQYPRARDLALQCRRAGCPSSCGGFHVSSHAPIARLSRRARRDRRDRRSGDHLAALLDDHLRGALRAEYRVERRHRARTGLADIAVPDDHAAPLPAMDARYLAASSIRR